jgi:mannosyltransferase
MCRASQNNRHSPDFLQTIIGLVAIVVLAVLLRVLFLGKESLTWDEISSVRVAGGDWSHLVRTLWYGDVGMHPQGNMSFYYTLLHIWMGLGRSEFVLRLLSVLVAAGTIPLCYLLATELFGRRTGLVASLLLALNVFHIRYAQEVRSYALLVLLVTLSSLLFVRGIWRPSWKVWASYTGATVLGIYSHFFAALVLAAHWISLAFLRRRDVPWRFVAMSACSAGVLLLPLVVFVLRKDTGQIGWIPRPAPDAIPQALVYLAGAGPMWDTTMPGPLLRAAEAGRNLLLVVYSGAIAAALLNAGRLWVRVGMSRETWKYSFLLAWLLVPPILAYLVSLVKPLFLVYYLIVSVPPLIVLAADGLSRIRPRPAVVAALVVWVGLTMVQAGFYYEFGRRENWRDATQYILSRAHPEDGVLFLLSTPAGFEYYRTRFHRAPSAPPVIVSENELPREDLRRLWVMVRDDGQEGSPQSVAAGRYTLVQEQRFVGVRVLLYRRIG